jgi:hypothetical protein
MASGVAHHWFRAGFKLCLTETSSPMAIRRLVSFSEAVYDGEKTVEGVKAGIPGMALEMLRERTPVTRGIKIHDLDPRRGITYCTSISDKVRTLEGALLRAIVTLLPQKLSPVKV